MNSGVQNLVVSLGAMQLARRIPFDDPVVLNYVRLAYLGSQIVALGVYYYVSLQSQEEPKLVTTTVRDYDLSETSKALRSVYMGILMMGVMHLYFKFTQPLFIQALMGLKNLYDAKTVAIHLFGKAPTGELKRPFKVASMFGAATGPQTDAAAIAEAEKRVTKKDE
ncbi:hypothetical protein CVT24_001305 [Panaeolus cyanescens]|uniref:Inorganic phosphate transporter n=1 Tax=Panaeolus cyanescens TaxID=181874 RepID=A0A409YZ20_9AGAR|nr:hypothetical protein CVT24_001305 [Panaeolus cyanescens]